MTKTTEWTKTFTFLVTSLRTDPFTVKVDAADKNQAEAAFWSKIEKMGIDQAEWETNGYSHQLQGLPMTPAPVTTELQMIAYRREFLALHGLTINSARLCGPARKRVLSEVFQKWLEVKGVADRDDPRWRTTPQGAAAK